MKQSILTTAPGGRQPNENIPHPDIVTGQQIGNLLNITNSMQSMLLNPMREAEVIPGAHNPPGNARDSAEATFINACSRLDDIISDKSRWGTEFQRSLEATAAKFQQSNVDLVNAQAAAAKEITTPHFRFRPDLQRTPDGKNWVAFIGDPNTDHCVLGVGRSPEEAMRNFDSIFEGSVPPYMIEWLLAREQALTAGVVPPPMPTPNKNEQQLDRKRNKTAPGASRSRKNRSPNRRNS